MKLSILICAIIFFVKSIQKIHGNLVSPPHYAVGNNLVVDLSTKILTLNNGSVAVATGHIGNYIPFSKYQVSTSTNEVLKANWDNSVELTIQLNDALSDSSVIVYDVLWMTNSQYQLSDAFVLSPYHWYGGAEYPTQQGWILDKRVHPMWAYVTGRASAMERYWLSSSHVAITVDDDVPLSVSLNFGDDYLRFLSKYQSTVYANFVDDIKTARPFLKYKLWVGVGDQGQSLKSLHLNVIQKYFGLATGAPDQRMLTSPVWSTWARYKQTINQSQVLDFANEIVQHNFSGCQIEIDDAWATNYGDMTFDPVKFPNVPLMCDTVHNLGFRVTVWVHPFANMGSATANDTSFSGYWVKYPNNTPSLVSWWDGVGYILDSTNPKAVQWFVGRLNDFKTQYNVDSFKFDAGETNWLGTYFKLYNATYPNLYSTLYTNMASQLGSFIEV